MTTTVPAQNQAPEQNTPVKKPFQGFRKLYHVLASSFFPLTYLYLPFHMEEGTCRMFLLMVAGVSFLVSFLLDVLRLMDKGFNSKFMRFFSLLVRDSEEKRLNGSTFLCLAFFLVMLFFPARIAIASMFFLSLGDAAAELCGRYFGRTRIFGKSWEGTGAFFLVAFGIAFSLWHSWPIALIGALAGALIELFSFDWDDNFTVPIGSAAVIWLVSRFLGI
jgi:acyl phosphate:glycerol-3-phosphate acyltransferase